MKTEQNGVSAEVIGNGKVLNVAKKIELLKDAVDNLLQGQLVKSEIMFGELTITVRPENLERVMLKLRDDSSTMFEQCVDMCGVDYLEYGDNYEGDRFAVVYHLLSITKNWRLRVRAFILDSNFPIIQSLVNVWSSLNWLEREAFDLFGIVFEGHPDLRRILTDYGFIGYPFRKDFPLSGYVEMRYDEVEHRVVYQPVTIEPREIVKRVIREDSYNGRH
jgi:NADH-quinone oxidoreductase subunit C